MTQLHIPAADLQVGDLVHVHDGRTATVRHIAREGADVTVNPGDDDQLDGRPWETATITREG